MIRINDKYGIELDEANYILVRFRVAGEKSKNAGVEEVITIGYYSTLEGVLKAALKTVEMETLASMDCDLEEALKVVIGIRESYDGLLNKVLGYERETKCTSASTAARER